MNTALSALGYALGLTTRFALVGFGLMAGMGAGFEFITRII